MQENMDQKKAPYLDTFYAAFVKASIKKLYGVAIRICVVLRKFSFPHHSLMTLWDVKLNSVPMRNVKK